MSARDLFGGDDIYTTYNATIAVRHRLVGGVPSSPSVIRKWLESRLEVGDPRLQEILSETIQTREDTPSFTEKLDLLMEDPDIVSINGFKRNSDGELCYEGRCMKALLKESANSAYPGVDYPGKKDGAKARSNIPAKKGLMRTLAEFVFVPEDMIPLGIKASEIRPIYEDGAPGWVEERIKHVITPQGPRSAINRVEVIAAPTLDFTVKIRDDFLPNEALGRMWQVAEEIGIGSDRARSDGRFDLVRWERVS